MNSRNYEQVSWQSDSLGRNIQIVQEVVAQGGCPALANSIPLFAGWSSHSAGAQERLPLNVARQHGHNVSLSLQEEGT